MKYENIYFSLPGLFQSLIFKLNSYIAKRKRYNLDFQKYLDDYERSNSQETDISKLHEFIDNASASKYWSRIFSETGFDIKASDIIGEIEKLPIMNKSVAKQFLYEISIPGRIKSNQSVHTSGTTGSGFVFPRTREMEQRQWAVWWRYRKWHGIQMNTWMGWFGGRLIISAEQKKPPFWRVSRSTRQVMFSPLHLNSSTAKYYYNELDKRNIKWLHGYPSQIALLARQFKDRHFSKLSNITHITVGAESLMEHQRILIEDVFGVKVYQHYGLAEGVANISQGVDGQFYIDRDFCLVELVPIDKTNPSECKIVGTNYNNLAFPLIRYDTGDIATVLWGEDNAPTILSIDGRQEDYITLPNGTKLGRLDHIFKDLTEVNEAQVYQPNKNKIILKIVKGPNYYNVNQEKALIKETRKRLGSEIEIDIQYYEKIQRTKSGKLRLVISEIE